MKGLLNSDSLKARPVLQTEKKSSWRKLKMLPNWPHQVEGEGEPKTSQDPRMPAPDIITDDSGNDLQSPSPRSLWYALSADEQIMPQKWVHPTTDNTEGLTKLPVEKAEMWGPLTLNLRKITALKPLPVNRKKFPEDPDKVEPPRRLKITYKMSGYLKNFFTYE